MTALPQPASAALEHSRQLAAHIAHAIQTAGGWISFADYMHLALYAPGIGYYSAGAAKFGEAGDFVTAPEISPLFAQTLAKQAAQVLRATNGSVLELGAGTGKLAAGLLHALAADGCLPERYYILEVSAYLRAKQRETIQQLLPANLAARVEWLDVLPAAFNGLILGNEVLDALPVHLIASYPEKIMERGVALAEEGFAWREQPLTAELEQALMDLDLPAPYVTEICPSAEALMTSLGLMLQSGVILMIDYGFPRREYYHPQRQQGTLMCHYRHHAHGDPFYLPGLQDITAHVDFSRIAQAASNTGLALLGFTSQAQFLINCGITDILANVSPEDIKAYAPLASAAQKLLSPAEMGELFKVIAMGRGIQEPLQGFMRGDKRHTL